MKKIYAFMFTAVLVLGSFGQAFANSPALNTVKDNESEVLLTIQDIKVIDTVALQNNADKRVFYEVSASGTHTIGSNKVNITTTFICIEDNNGNLEIYDHDTSSSVNVKNVSGWYSVRSNGTATSNCVVVNSSTAKMYVEYSARQYSNSEYETHDAQITFRR